VRAWCKHYTTQTRGAARTDFYPSRRRMQSMKPRSPFNHPDHHGNHWPSSTTCRSGFLVCAAGAGVAASPARRPQPAGTMPRMSQKKTKQRQEIAPTLKRFAGAPNGKKAESRTEPEILTAPRRRTWGPADRPHAPASRAISAAMENTRTGKACCRTRVPERGNTQLLYNSAAIQLPT
jgi:hypothetical protein